MKMNKMKGEAEYELSETHFCSLGSAIPADISQILLPQIQRYKIPFEGGIHLSKKFAWKISFYNIC